MASSSFVHDLCLPVTIADNKAMRVPTSPDLVQLDDLLTRATVLAELRASDDTLGKAEDLLWEYERRLLDLAASETRHRDWRELRPIFVRLLAELEDVLYGQTAAV